MTDKKEAEAKVAAIVQKELRGYIPQLESYISKAKKDPNHAAKTGKLETLIEMLQTE